MRGPEAYRFGDEALLRQALTHRSSGRKHNERLEFLGDALLGFIVADMLYQRFPDADEGQLTRSRAALVNRTALASVARSMDLGSRLLLGEGEMKSGGWRRDSILANALEALVGAIYIDGGIEACREQVAAWFEPLFAEIDPANTSKDAKTELQEYLQARGLPLPRYRKLETVGPSHEQTFHIECAVNVLPEPVVGHGPSRRRAEQDAARRVIESLRRNEP